MVYLHTSIVIVNVWNCGNVNGNIISRNYLPIFCVFRERFVLMLALRRSKVDLSCAVVCSTAKRGEQFPPGPRSLEIETRRIIHRSFNISANLKGLMRGHLIRMTPSCCSLQMDFQSVGCVRLEDGRRRRRCCGGRFRILPTQDLRSEGSCQRQGYALR